VEIFAPSNGKIEENGTLEQAPHLSERY